MMPKGLRGLVDNFGFRLLQFSHAGANHQTFRLETSDRSVLTLQWPLVRVSGRVRGQVGHACEPPSTRGLRPSLTVPRQILSAER